MTPSDVQVITQVQQWQRCGVEGILATVVHTYGSAPRQPGAMVAICRDGTVVGSVSGGCAEACLVDRMAQDANALRAPELISIGASAEDKIRFRLPCNGHIDLWVEPLGQLPAEAILQAVASGGVIERHINLETGASAITRSTLPLRAGMVGRVFSHPIGPTHRLILIGAADVSAYLAPMATALGFQVDVIDPREEYALAWHAHERAVIQMAPDDALNHIGVDGRTAIVALSHDPRIDDMALMAALPSPAFYVAAMGSRANTEARKRRLLMLDLTEAQVGRLHGPAGLDIGARTPAEIAVAIAAELVLRVRKG
jgi:xanthine dehydrogenase accessory factor